MAKVTDASASGGSYINTNTTYQGSAAYNLNVTESGTYKIIGQVYAPGESNDSFYVQIDNEPLTNLESLAWDLNPTKSADQFSVWREDELTRRGIGTFDNPQYDPYTVNLTAGTHTLTIRGREPNTRLDYFYLAKTSSPPATTLTYNITNFTQLAADWLKTMTSPADVTKDGMVDTRDLTIMMNNWKP
jgi:hypothetical protein